MKKFLLVGAVVALTGCSTIVDSPLQTVRFELDSDSETTARCMLESTDFKQQVVVPGTHRVQRSHNPTEIFCLSANGREARQPVKVIPNKSYKKNAVSWGPYGFLHDYWTKSAYRYPDVITVDFDANMGAINKGTVLKTYQESVDEEVAETERDMVEKGQASYPEGAYFGGANPSERFKYAPNSYAAQPTTKGDPANVQKVLVKKPIEQDVVITEKVYKRTNATGAPIQLSPAWSGNE